MKDAAILDKMYDQNLEYFKELSLYIAAGKKKLEDTRNVQLPDLVQKANSTGLPGTSRRLRIWRPCANGLRRRYMTWS